jgi:hypothetical protein
MPCPSSSLTWSFYLYLEVNYTFYKAQVHIF